MTDIIKDLATLTSVPEDILKKLVQQEVWLMCNSIYENLLQNEVCTQIGLGYGTLIIQNTEEDIQYKFIPDKDLEEAVKTTLVEGTNPLKKELKTSLANKIINTYKNIL